MLVYTISLQQYSNQNVKTRYLFTRWYLDECEQYSTKQYLILIAHALALIRNFFLSICIREKQNTALFWLYLCVFCYAELVASMLNSFIINAKIGFLVQHMFIYLCLARSL